MSQEEIAANDAMVIAGICPACKGTGLEDGTGDACGGDGGDDSLACAYCMGEGCGGTCSWCGSTGKFADWKHGNPSYEGMISDHLLPEISTPTEGQ